MELRIASLNIMNCMQWIMTFFHNFGKKKTQGYIGTFIIPVCRKVTEDVEANQTTTAYQPLSFKNVWIKEVGGNRTPKWDQNSSHWTWKTKITTILRKKKLCSRHANTYLGRKGLLKYFFPQFQRSVCTHLSNIAIRGGWWP